MFTPSKPPNPSSSRLVVPSAFMGCLLPLKALNRSRITWRLHPPLSQAAFTNRSANDGLDLLKRRTSPGGGSRPGLPRLASQRGGRSRHPELPRGRTVWWPSRFCSINCKPGRRFWLSFKITWRVSGCFCLSGEFHLSVLEHTTRSNTIMGLLLRPIPACRVA